MSTLSRASDVSFTTIKRYFKKPYSYATTDTLEKIALTLGVEVGDLVERVPDMVDQKNDLCKATFLMCLFIICHNDNLRETVTSFLA